LYDQAATPFVLVGTFAAYEISSVVRTGKKYGDVHKTSRKYDGRAGAHASTIIADQDTDQADGDTTCIGAP
jgi:hypothetical protein